MKITNVKQQIKRAGRYSIFVDGKYSFSLSENELLSLGIGIGKEYSPEEFEKLQQTAILDKAYMRVLDLLARRARSKWEIEEYLKSKDYTHHIIDLTVEHLFKKGYIDDEKFAQSWVQSRRLLKSISKRKLQMELKQKRVPQEIISQVLESDETSEKDVLKELVSKKQKQAKYQDETKLMQYLSRQGFNYEDIKEAVKTKDLE